MSDGMFMYNVSEGTRLLVENVWNGHYKKSNDKTPADSLQRVVDFIYQNEKGSYEHKLAKDMLMNGYFNPGGRIHAGAGTGNLVTLQNCFVMADIEDSLDSIMDVLKQSALTSQQGGGIGMNFSSLRPKNAIVRRTNSVSSGVLPFMDMWHYMCATIKSAGTRRGAMMGILRCDHPDIIDFIAAKQTQGRLTNFNVSVAITDEFMEAVEGDLPWHLHFPVPEANQHCQTNMLLPDGTMTWVYKILPARELWDMILKNTYEYSEPGVIFIDRINDLNNLSYCERISATNPCVTAGTMMFTVSGIQKAMDVVPGYGVWNTGLRGGVADEIEVYEHQPIYKVTFSDGGELECTAGHIFYTMAHHQSLEYSTLRTDELQQGTLVRVSEGPKYYNTKTELAGIDMFNLNNFDYGYHYGAALVKNNWVKRYLPKLDTTICEMILETIPDSKPEYKVRISDTVLHKAHFTIHRGIMMGIVDTLGVMEKVDTPDFQIAVPIPNNTLRKQLRLIFLCNGVHPLYRESDNAFLLKGDNLKPLQMHVQPDSFYRAIQSHLAAFVPQPINWTARVVSVEDMKKTDIVFDVYEKVTDSWVTEGYASKGCVPYETKLLTKSGYKEIGVLIGQDVEVWNGFEWSWVKPFSTGFAQIYKVTLSNGMEFLCDDRHRFPINGAPVYTRDLQAGMRIDKCSYPVIRKGNEYKIDAYSQGFYAGDGSVDNTTSFVYFTKWMCIPRLIEGKFGDEPPSKRGYAKPWYHGEMLPKNFVPIDGSLEYCLNWLAGLADSDGCVVNKTNSKMIFISSVDKEFLLNVQLMLTRLGVHAPVTNEHKKLTKQMPGGVYTCNPTYHLMIGANSLNTLTDLGFHTERLDLSGNYPVRDASRFTTIISVEATNRYEETFCATEKLRNTLIFNGLYTSNCGEQPLPPFGQCDLGSINLARLVIDPFSENAKVDIDSLYKAIEAGVRFLDNVLDVSNYPLKEQEKEAHSKRRIGLGITGLANMLEFLKIRYGSQECIKYVGEMMHTIMDHTYRCSALLAREKGSFPLFDLEEFKKSPMWDKLSSETQWCIEHYGIRNGVLLTVAPTGSTSIYYGNVSGGLEPVFSHRYMRKVLQPDDSWKELMVHDYAFDKYCEQFGEPADLADLPDYMVTANELTVNEHLAVQAVIQQYIDSSVSKTINCPSDMDYEQFKGVYEKAYALGLKGCTTYRPSLVRGWIMKEVDKMSTEDCCEHPNLVIEEGCSKCLNCGTSKCTF